MKWLNFSLLLFLLSLSTTTLIAQDSIYQHRLERYQTVWSRLMPRHYKIQYAGSMGLLSFGPGWEYGKHHQWETDIFFGFLPKYDTEDNKITFTLKENYIPWTTPVGKYFAFNPFTVSLYLNSILSGKFWVKEPEKYPGNKYYGFSTRIRLNLAFGQRVVYYIPSTRRRYNKSLTFFYELGTNDFYLASAFTNRYLKLRDIIHLSLGLKMEIF